MTDDEILKLAVERIDEAASADQNNRDQAEDDLRFVIGQQWPDNVRAEREAAGKPCLTINGLSQFVRQVTSQIRQINPAIRAIPADGAASKETAEIIEGLIRQIEYQSDASTIYETAAESAAACGIGHWRILTRYCDGETFDQEIHLKRIHNPFAVFWDPLAKDPTRSDARYVFVVEEMAREVFEKEYPDASPDSITSNNQVNTLITWSTTETVTVAEYMWIDYRKVKIGMTANGQIVRDPRPPMQFVKTREVSEPYVRWVKMTGSEILEGPTEIPSPYLPVIAVTGEEWHVGEQMYRSSVIRFAKDPQQLYNYARSTQAEVITLQPRAPFLVTVDQVAGLEEHWATAGQDNRAYLVYNPDDKAGAPQRIQPPVSSQALMNEISLAAEDMKRTTGIYDASLGAQSNEKSGVAIRERKMEAQANTSVYADNMVKSITQTGRILVAMIPRVYDTNRVIRILGEDDQEQLAVINEMMIAGGQVMPVNDMTVGKYDVRISVGPSYSTKRQEASEGMTAFLQAVPQAAPLVMDLVAKSQDWPDADRFAERLKKGLPAGVADDEKEDGQQQDPAAAMQMQQQQMQMQAQQVAMQADLAEKQAGAEKAMADAEKAKADAVKAQAEAQKAVIEAQAMQLQQNAAMMAHTPIVGVQSPIGQ